MFRLKFYTTTMHFVLMSLCSIIQLTSSNGQILINSYQKFFTTPLKGDNLEEFLGNIHFRCYKTINDYVNISYYNAVHQLPSECMKYYNQTVIFFFDGFVPNSTIDRAPLTQNFFNAILTHTDAVLIEMKYQKLVSAGGCDNEKRMFSKWICLLYSYWSSANNVSIIAQKVETVFAALTKSRKINLENIRLIGFSLGAQLILQMAERFYKDTGQVFYRVTAIEPAGPMYYSVMKLSYKNHIKYLDVIHTNPAVYGDTGKLGTVDFYINFPKLIQPGCPGILSFILGVSKLTFGATLCSHRRALQIYTESILYPKNFQACCNPFLFCDNEVPVYMGYNMEPKIIGICFLKTKSKYPYGKGLKGARLF